MRLLRHEHASVIHALRMHDMCPLVLLTLRCALICTVCYLVFDCIWYQTIELFDSRQDGLPCMVSGC